MWNLKERVQMNLLTKQESHVGNKLTVSREWQTGVDTDTLLHIKQNKQRPTI